MSFLKDIAAGTILGDALGLESSAEKAARRSSEALQEAAQKAISEEVRPAVGESLARFEPFSDLGLRGVDLSGFLADPQAQAQLAFNNPLFQLSRQALTEDINQNAASRGRLKAGDTLTRLQEAGALAAQPFIDRQRQDILNLLNIGQQAAGAQGSIQLGGAQSIVDLLTGGANAKAAGIVGAENARQQNFGNLLDVAGLFAGAPQGGFSGLFSGSGGNTPPPGFGG